MKLVLDCLGLIPFISLFLTIAWFRLKLKLSNFGAAIQGSIAWSLLILLETNILSFSDCITQGYILAFWLIYFCVILYLVFQFRRQIKFTSPLPRSWLPILLILFITLVGALAYAPDFHDSLAYHLARIMHWIQNKSMAPYVTSIDRQIGMAPFNAIVILQSMAICNNDYFVNLPQWLAFAGCVAGAAALARQLGASVKIQFLSAFYFCTVPIAIMQSGNSESSLIATFWLCAFVSAFLSWRSQPNWRDSVILGSALGLAILSKGIAYPIALPFVACIAWLCLRHFKRFFLYGLCAALLIMAINAPHFYRNYEAASSPALSAERNIIIKPTPALTAVNALFNFLLQEPWLVNLTTKENWSKLALTVGVDDHDKTFFPWRGIETARVNLVPSDIDGQSPVHALLILLFLPWLTFRRIPRIGLYLGLTYTTFLVYFAIITWQPWAARLHLPFFLLCAPLMGFSMARLAWEKLRQGILLALAITSFMPLFFCLEHPLGPPTWLSGYRENILHFTTSSRDEQYFNFWRHIRKPYMDAVDFLARQHPQSIGVDLGDDGQEYPLWAMLNKKLPQMPQIVHTLPPYPTSGNGPDYIFMQRHTSFSPLLPPVVYKKIGTHYEQVFPARDIKSPCL